eukprot:sb/3465011/
MCSSKLYELARVTSEYETDVMALAETHRPGTGVNGRDSETGSRVGDIGTWCDPHTHMCGDRTRWLCRQGVGVVLSKRVNVSVVVAYALCPYRRCRGQCEGWVLQSGGITTSKLFQMVLLGRMEDGLERLLRENQCGFRKGRSCIDQIFSLRMAIHQASEYNLPLFIDVKAAFDSINRGFIWAAFKNYGLPDKYIRILRSFFDGTVSAVRWAGGLSEWFEVLSGTGQGDIQGPVVFNVCLNLAVELSEAHGSPSRGLVLRQEGDSVETVLDCDYADDMAVMDSTEAGLQESTDLICKFSEYAGLKLTPPWVAHEFLFARRNLVLALTPLFLDQFGQIKVLRTLKIKLFPVMSGFLPKTNGGCHAQIRRRATKGVTTSKNPTLQPEVSLKLVRSEISPTWDRRQVTMGNWMAKLLLELGREQC